MSPLLERLPARLIDSASGIVQHAQLQLTPPPSGSTAVTPIGPVTITVGPRFDTTEVLIGVIVLLVLTVVYYFVQRALTNSLIAGNARPQKAALAGWTLFALLFVLTATAIFSVIGSLWHFLVVFLPVIGLDVIVIVVFVASLMSARRSARIL